MLASSDVAKAIGSVREETEVDGVLRGLSRLDVIEGDSLGFRPFGQSVSDELR